MDSEGQRNTDPACFICGFPLSIKNTRRVTDLTLKTLQDASLKRNDTRRDGFKVGMELHVSCLINYPLEKLIKSQLRRQQKEAVQLRKQQDEAHRFEFKKHCIFCGNLATKQSHNKFSIISNDKTKDSFNDLLSKNPDHTYSNRLRNCLNTDEDLVKVEARQASVIHFIHSLRDIFNVASKPLWEKIIVTLANLGLCASYYETMTSEDSIANDPEYYAIIAAALLQWAADNFDDNTATLDGFGTCHKLGMIECVDPGSAIAALRRIIRCTKLRSEELVKNCGFVPFVPFVPQNRDGLKNLPIANLKEEFREFYEDSAIGDDMKRLNLFWSYCKNLKPAEIDGFHGFMTKAYQHHSFTISGVVPLQFVDENPSNTSTIWSALLETVRKAKKMVKDIVLLHLTSFLMQKQ
ncbi:hypothetical protein QAD02_000397 [Eretmocerus hayati]|uniref:Uncharacterized protein n=1 Tax=Eretmocerus hayati TaxID=131215 RepID=A0ACC2NED7_9HYME|nr:hypothetical protein QAD02_000397 [Eretmocerus hayati]